MTSFRFLLRLNCDEAESYTSYLERRVNRDLKISRNNIKIRCTLTDVAQIFFSPGIWLLLPRSSGLRFLITRIVLSVDSNVLVLQSPVLWRQSFQFPGAFNTAIKMIANVADVAVDQSQCGRADREQEGV